MPFLIRFEVIRETGATILATGRPMVLHAAVDSPGMMRRIGPEPKELRRRMAFSISATGRRNVQRARKTIDRGHRANLLHEQRVGLSDKGPRQIVVAGSDQLRAAIIADGMTAIETEFWSLDDTIRSSMSLWSPNQLIKLLRAFWFLLVEAVELPPCTRPAQNAITKDRLTMMHLMGSALHVDWFSANG
jgi:hypothetical protein